MQATNAPSKSAVPFAESGSKNTIPVASQIGVQPGLASFTDGFPPLTMTPLAAGGIPPRGQDFNGILYFLSAAARWQQAGGSYSYDSAFATAIGGYPKGAVLLAADGQGFWLSAVDSNTANPDTGGAGWVPAFTYGVAAVAGLTNANVTLSAGQYSKPIITLAGTLTGNVQIIFPATLQQWVVVNNTAGGFTVTCRTASGSGVAIPQGTNQAVYGDGTNLNPIGVTASQAAGGQCRLSVATASSLRLSPYNGSTIIINGAPRQIPAAGVTVTNSGVTASALRYVYAFMSGSTMALEVVATGHSTGTDGIEIKTGDPSRSLVGMVYTNASSQFVDSVTQRHCLNWFNRRTLNCYLFNVSSFNFTSSVGAEISTTLRASFLSWSDEATTAAITGYAAISTGNIANIQVSIDGSVSLVGGSFSIFPPSGGGQGGYSSVATLTLSEGLHNSQIWGAVGGGATGTLQNTVNTVEVRG